MYCSIGYMTKIIIKSQHFLYLYVGYVRVLTPNVHKHKGKPVSEEQGCPSFQQHSPNCSSSIPVLLEK